jgi:hypothetical protein
LPTPPDTLWNLVMFTLYLGFRYMSSCCRYKNGLAGWGL